MPWLVCIWRPHAYEGCKGSCQGDGPWRSDDGASSPQHLQSWFCLCDPATAAVVGDANDGRRAAGGRILLHSALLPWRVRGSK